MYTNDKTDYILANQLGGDGVYDGVWEGDLDKGRAKACPPNYQKKGNGHFREGAYNWYIQCDKKPYEDTTFYKNHRNVNNLLWLDKDTAYEKISSMCNKTPITGNGNLYKGSSDCRDLTSTMCKNGVVTGCDYLKGNEVGSYKTAMGIMCKKPENITKSVCKSYFENNWSNTVNDSLNEFCQGKNSDGKFRWEDGTLTSGFCSCHKPRTFYEKLSKEIREKWKGPPKMDEKPVCVYPRCESNGMHAPNASDKCKGVAFTQCVQNVEINADGDIINNGEITESYNEFNSPLETQIGNNGTHIIPDMKYDDNGNLWIVNSGVYPLKMLSAEGVWYSYSDVTDLNEIVELHLRQGQVVSRLLID